MGWPHVKFGHELLTWPLVFRAGGNGTESSVTVGRGRGTYFAPVILETSNRGPSVFWGKTTPWY